MSQKAVLFNAQLFVNFTKIQVGMGKINDVNTPHVSVCCTTYNLVSYLPDTIDSILNQKTTFSYEIIIHDDASTDGTKDIIKTYAEKYPDLIRPIFQENNIYTTYEGRLGFMFNNFILPEARGKYIAICDGDDFWTDPRKLQKQVNFLEREKDCSACTTNALVVNEISNKKKKFHSGLEDNYLPESKIIITGGAVYPTSTLVFSKYKFTSSKVYDHYNELSKYYDYDTLFIYCLLFEGKIGYLKDCTAVYRRWEGGIYSGIMHDPEKVSVLKEGEMTGNKKLLKIVTGKRRKLFKRKISVDALYVLRHKKSLYKYKYFFDLTAKEFIKYIINK